MANANPTAQRREYSNYKLVFVGDVETGKTSVINRYVHGEFDANYQTTIGIDFLSKVIRQESRTVRLQLWDTAGQERFRSLIPSYIRDASGVMVVYDVTKRASFTNTSQWITHVREQQGEAGTLVLVGNKIDLASDRQVSTEEGQKLAEEQKLLFFEVSAKTGENIEQLFQNLVEALPMATPTPRRPSNDQSNGQAGGQMVELSKPPETASSKCSC